MEHEYESNQLECINKFNWLTIEELLLFDNPLPTRNSNLYEYEPDIKIEIHSDEIDTTKDITNQIKIDNIEKPKKPRGRKRNNSNDNRIFQTVTGRVHNKFSADNMFKKIQTHFFSFIPAYLNVILIELALLDNKEKLIKISYQFIKEMKIKKISSLLNMTIGKILEKDTNHKFKSKNNNTLILKKIKNCEIGNKLLSETYINLFKNIYYRNKRFVKLGNYGIIELRKDKVEMYEDFIEKNSGDENYMRRLDEYICKKFFRYK